MQQPYYMIDFNACACMFEIRVNDYPVISLNVEGQVSSNIPINFAILESGKQNVSCIIVPFLGQNRLLEESKLEFTINLYDVTNEFSFVRMIENYKSEVVDSNKIIPIIKDHSEFIAEVPYELKAWQNGIKLSNNDEILKKLKNKYNELVTLINTEKYDAFLNQIKPRENNMAKSMYLSEYETKSRISELITDFKNGFKVTKLDPNSIIQFYAYGKVAVFKKINGEPAFSLINEDTQEELMLDFTFYIPEGKTEFEII
ncbi:hypothetical protein [Flavobacterium oreochromis]|uniref:Uncharacterized protein n=1 Tax=Flavobacterium columnare TaxID=996 RepID=A0A246G7G0_9FLAO|nr:hypothetical protein [Flavobacterium oreochromis]OWP74432.1 hypothetical protein BWK62_14355 [Flavobacterium oreochromis]